MPSFQLIVLVITVIINICLVCTLLLSKTKTLSIKYFSYLVLVLVGWMISNYFCDHPINNNLALFWNRLTFSLASLLSPFLFFAWYFPNNKAIMNWRTKNTLVFLSVFVSLLSLFTPLIIKDVDHFSWGTNALPGPLYFLFVADILGFILSGIVILFRKIWLTKNKEKTQILYMFTGLLISSFSLVFIGVVLPLFSGYTKYGQFTGLCTIPFVGLTTYAIVKHQLFNIKVVLTEIAVGIIVVAMLVQSLAADGIAEKAVNWSIFLIVAYGSYLLVKSVIKEIKQREEMEQLANEREKALEEVDERNRNLVTLQKFSNIVLNNDELKPMIQKIIKTIPAELQDCMGVFVALSDPKEEKMNGFSFAAKFGTDADLIKKLENATKTFSMSIKNQESLILMSYQYQRIQRGNNMTDFFCPPFDKTKVHNLQLETKIKGVVAVPLYAINEKFGVLVFVLNHPVDDISQESVNMMSAIANEVSLAAQRALAYENLKKANEYLKELDKMKDEFISVASHELNTPLAAIQGYLSMILEEGMGKVDKTAEEYLNRVYASSKRLAALILDLLNVSRIEQGRVHLMYNETLPEELIKSVIDELVVKSDMKKIYLKFEKPHEVLPKTWCDVNRIREVLINLVGNGIKFTEQGGITMSVEVVGKMLEFHVSDTGAGIKQEDTEKLFRKFSQLNREKNEFQGTGLGLFISKKYVELHNGKIWVESELGKGTTFKFRLPILKDKPIDEHEGEGAVLSDGVTPAEKIDDKNAMSSYLEEQKVA